MLTEAVEVEHNHKTIAAIDHQGAIRIILDFSISHCKSWPLSRDYFGSWNMLYWPLLLYRGGYFREV